MNKDKRANHIKHTTSVTIFPRNKYTEQKNKIQSVSCLEYQGHKTKISLFYLNNINSNISVIITF